MSFLTTQPEELAAAAGKLETIGSAMVAQNAAAAAPTTTIFNIGAGNWASAASDLLGLASGGLLPAAEEAALEEGLEGAGLSELGAAEAAVGEAPIAAGLGAAPLAAGLSRASSIGALSVPPSWAGQANLVSSTSTLQGAGWTTAAPHGAAGTVIPGMPGLASATRSSAGFGAPRYGAKPIVVPKPAV